MRTCVVTRAKRTKRELIRIVRTPSGDVQCDPSGRLDGRGAYITLDDTSVRMALAQGILDKHLQSPIDDEMAKDLIRQVMSEVRRRRVTEDGDV
ncbi:MAG: DNA-binding protein [Chloroflexi bacterium]|nr:DNA-binding protein [Chloroflexota bacterium]HCU73426.1 DUF448 domain-containing protein [Chloroflexota bacterium]